MIVREGIGWFTLELYTSSENEAQTTDIDIELSELIHANISDSEYCDACIKDDNRNVNIRTSSVYEENIEIGETIHLDIGKVTPFKGE